MKTTKTGRVPIKSWCNSVEEGAFKQAENLSNLPFAFKHIALMSDCHQGYGMPIGGVLATHNVVVPNAVGVDIGCGMLACKTDLKNVVGIKDVLGKIRKRIPVGFSHHKEPQTGYALPEARGEICKQEYDSALHQLGTLGGGNHFIEIQRGSDGYIWVMLHSGSRNLGYKVAKHYNKVAQELNEAWYSSVPKSHELAFLPVGTEECRNYLEEMYFCKAFAELNRQVMWERIGYAFNEVYSNKVFFNKPFDVSHNYVDLENHFGKNVWVHRKGAIRVREGEVGIIPGSQGTKSYIVKGLGNKDSFCSCSHGAGRVMGRKQAQRELSLEEEVRKLEEKGVVHSIRTVEDLGEAPSAYKDIDEVMESQKNLVEVLVELEPLAVVKG